MMGVCHTSPRCHYHATLADEPHNNPTHTWAHAKPTPTHNPTHMRARALPTNRHEGGSLT